MQQKEDNRRTEFASCNITPEKLQRTPRDSGSARRNIMSQEIKRRIQCSPHNSQEKYSKTPQSTGSRRDAKPQSESNKRKIQSSHNESLEKIQKTCSSGKFVNTLIGQWSRHMGIQTPLSQTGRIQENSMTEEMKQIYAIEERKVQKLQKKLQAAEETISSLSASHETELRAKEEILQQLNSDWESITKYYDEISESLKGFQQHKDNLTTLYNDVIVVQQSTVKKLQQELRTMKLKDEEHRNIVNTIENQVMNQERRIQEMINAEVKLKKQFEDAKNQLASQKDHLQNVHAEEKLELIQKQENLTLMNRELQVQLQKITEEKQNLSNVFTEKDDKITKLQEEIATYENKTEHLLYQNAELSEKYEKLIEKEVELSKELQSKTHEVDRLRENLNARQEIESSLAKDLDMIDSKCRTMQTDFVKLEKELKEAQQCKLNLEKSLEDVKLCNEQKIMELNKKMDLLEKEKERILSDKHSNIQEFEKTHQLLKEKHEGELASLKMEFDVKLTEMKEIIATQKSEYTHLYEVLYKTTKENENVQVSEVREQEIFEDQENIDVSKTVYLNKDEMSKSKQDIYNFNITEVNNDLPNILLQTKQSRKIRFNLNSPTQISDNAENYSYLQTQPNVQVEETQKSKRETKNGSTPKKKIFKTRDAGLRQYGTPKKPQYGSPAKIPRK